ncbi:unnamed protein product, partial [Polarella glacialis]
FVFSHGDVQVAVGQRAKDPGQDPFAEDHTGDLVWPTALAFCRYLCDHEPLLQQKRVLDIGAGTGLVGLVASKLGAHVTLTDVPRVIPLLARNAAVDVAASGDLGGAEAPSSPSADLTDVKP